MNPNQILEEMQQKQQELIRGNKIQKELGIKKAETEKDYRTALAKEILRLRLEGTPTTILDNLAKGNEKVAELRAYKDIAESNYYTCVSSMENIRLSIEVLRSQLTWLRAELNNS